MNEAAQLLQSPVNEAVRLTSFWLILQRRRGGTEILTTKLSDARRVLPVFSFEAEALLYALADARVGSQARRTSAGELVSILYGPCRGVELVALDPWASSEAEALIGFVSLDRNRFLNFLVRKGRPAKLLRSISLAPDVGTGPVRPYTRSGHPRNPHSAQRRSLSGES